MLDIDPTEKAVERVFGIMRPRCVRSFLTKDLTQVEPTFCSSHSFLDLADGGMQVNVGIPELQSQQSLR